MSNVYSIWTSPVTLIFHLIFPSSLTLGPEFSSCFTVSNFVSGNLRGISEIYGWFPLGALCCPHIYLTISFCSFAVIYRYQSDASAQTQLLFIAYLYKSCWSCVVLRNKSSVSLWTFPNISVDFSLICDFILVVLTWKQIHDNVFYSGKILWDDF